MKEILNYTILETLGESMHSTVYKVCESKNLSTKLILRSIKPEFISNHLNDYLEQQIRQVSHLSLAITLLPEIKELSLDRVVLVQDYFSDISLTHWLNQDHTLKEKLEIMLSITQQLEDIHNAGHIHKGLKPNNILLGTDIKKNKKWVVRLIDDVRVLDINQLSHFIYDVQFRLFTLPYLSPEQTGRIRYSVNYSTDLYALGMILFEVLTGRQAFMDDDPLAIIHSHLATTAARVESINPEIPKILGDIVARLLDKSPEKRYQTALGLNTDLAQCLFQWERESTISEFPLGQNDFANHITIPSIMVGRDFEKAKMLAEFEQSCSGMFCSALISGLSGIGKTRLIQELQLPIVSHYAYFCSGKFDQFKKHIPYSTLIQAFSYLIRVVLTEDKKRLVYWQARIKKSLGNNARLMIDLIPDLALIIGEHAEVVDLPPVEARNRFNSTAGKFIACFANKAHPLVLFIDDLQWCDGASFDLFEQIFNNADEYKYLFFIGAYRHNEVDESHRLTRLISHIKQDHRPLLEIRLEALLLKDVNLMAAYILNTSASRTNALATVIYNTSLGNPLFVNESLRWLHSYKHLYLSKDGNWEWDDEHISHSKIPDSALDLFKDKISKLSDEDRNILAVASCLGARFNIEDLARVTKCSESELHEKLTEVYAQNILLNEKNQLLFFHDQVQAAAETFMNEEKKQRVHHAIAEAFIKDIPENSHYEHLPNLFAIVEHLSKGRLANTEKHDLYEEAQFNYHAGIAAMKSLAVDNANFFFEQARHLFPYDINNWGEHYNFLFLLYKYNARTEMALGNQSASEKILDILDKQCNTDLDRIDCLYEQTVGLSSLGNFTRAIKLGNRGLKYFDRDIPANDETCMQKANQLFDEIHVNDRDVWREILNTTPSEERSIKIEAGIYSELIPDYYLSGMVPQLYLAAIQSTQNCLTGGLDESVIYGFSMVGLYLQRKDEYSLSFKYEDLALALAERYPDTFGATKGINGILWTNRHNRKNSKLIIKECQENIHRGKNCGDLYNAGLSYGPYIWHLVTQGSSMQCITEAADECINFSAKFNLSLSLGLAQSAIVGWSAFMQDDAQQFSDAEISALIDKWQTDKHVVSIGGYYTLKGIAHHYLGDYQVAAENLELAQPYLRGLSDNILNRLWFVFSYINALHTVQRSDKENQLLDEYKQKVKTWAELGPVLKPYWALMQAEEAIQKNTLSEARRCYLDAIDASRKESFIFLEAFLEQRYGEMLLKHHHRNANHALLRAAILYRQCGSEIKARQLIEKHSIVIPQPENIDDLNKTMDMKFLQVSAASIAEQLELFPLINVVIKSIMERLSAKKAFLLLKKNDELKIFAKGIKDKVVDVQLSTNEKKLINSDGLSMAIANYVYSTQKTLVLDNACGHGDFQFDAAVIDQQLKSVICFPVIVQSRTIGLLYLENSLVASIFSPVQIATAQFLMTHANIAFENAYFMTEMKHKHDEVVSLKDYLQATLNSIGDAVITTDKKGNINRMNPIAEKLTGWPLKEARGQSVKGIFNILDISTQQSIDNLVDKVIASGEKVPIRNQAMLMSRDGSEYTIINTAAPIRNENDEIQGMVLSFFDVTEQYQLRDAADKNRRNLQAIMDYSPAVIYIKDIEHRYLFVNKKFENIFSVKQINIIGKTDPEIFPDNMAVQFQDIDKQVLESGEPLELEEIVLHDDEHTYMSTKFPLLDKDGNIYAVCGLSSDITQQKAQDEQLRRSQKMDALGKLTSGIMHDYNNMLGVILGYSDLLESMLTAQPKLAEYARQIYHAGKRGSKLTQKLLSFSRKETIEASKLDINTLLQEEQDMLQKILTVRIKLVIELTDGIWPVWLDNGDLEDAILNMSINAMHSIENDGVLTIHTCNQSFNTRDAQLRNLEAGDYVQLSLTDTGCGMNRATREKIFDPFFSTKGEKGTGLGLSQVFGFVKREGGSIQVYSEPGHGSQFILYFPRYRGEKHSTEENLNEPKFQELMGKEKILVVDDEEALLHLVSELLSQQGYKVFKASNTRRALKILEQENVDLMLSDIIMPEMDGYQLAAIVQEKYPSIKIQLASGFSDKRHIDLVDENLHQNMLHKPYHSLALFKKIRSLLDNNVIEAKIILREHVITQTEWNDSYNTGIAEMDKDHNAMFSLLNRCLEMSNKPDSNNELTAVCEELIEYTKYHFEREEKIMEACGYPQLNKHKKVHQFLLKEILEYSHEYNQGNLKVDVLLSFLTNWLGAHIAGMDKVAAEYCKSKQGNI
ncbi:MAG: bacteriohemerythrin [Gammaproteobacteria bacterium]|nr:bacteriohemerythrin [Gammaproteobacteria bacterium]